MKNYKSEQSGRSMVEMLAVLAIVGILSVAGIAGYSKAMSKFKEQKLADQVSTLTANIRTAYSSQSSYAGITSANVITYGFAPSDMVVGATLNNAMGGSVTIAPANVGGVANLGFTLLFTGLNKSSCMYLATSDWGSGSAGLNSMRAHSSNAAGGTSKASSALPFSLEDANTACGACGASNNTCVVEWTYY
ncbi:MAG: type 4 pilus major pilin [Alphaproteobacteria bacterium]|nr:type 4 pilus major pilin [Alphaproteobacteria bacterium]